MNRGGIKDTAPPSGRGCRRCFTPWRGDSDAHHGSRFEHRLCLTDTLQVLPECLACDVRTAQTLLH